MARGRQIGKSVDGSSLEVVQDGEIEVSSGRDIDDEMKQEAFMNESVEIILADTTDENAPPHVILSVNGVTQPIFRGVPTSIKRKFVEVLAHCKETKHTQRVANPLEPDRIETVARTAHAYPFEVTQDSGQGRAWLRAIMAAPA